MDTPPGGNVTVDVDAVARALSCLNVEAEILGSTPKGIHSKRRRDLGAKRTLFTENASAAGPPRQQPDRPTQRFPPWTAEEQALVTFILLYTDGKKWVSRASKGDQFWKNAGAYIQSQVHSEFVRTGIYVLEKGTVMQYATML